MILSDVFVFVNEFKPKLVRDFIKKYLQDFNSTETYYECPKYSEETIFETDSYSQMLEFVLSAQGRPYTFYLSNDNANKYKEAILQLNKDGSMCLVLSTDFEFEKEIFEELRASFPGHKVLISNNIPLPSSKEEVDTLS
jgi:hypothetical protein